MSSRRAGRLERAGEAEQRGGEYMRDGESDFSPDLGFRRAALLLASAHTTLRTRERHPTRALRTRRRTAIHAHTFSPRISPSADHSQAGSLAFNKARLRRLTSSSSGRGSRALHPPHTLRRRRPRFLFGFGLPPTTPYDDGYGFELHGFGHRRRLRFRLAGTSSTRLRLLTARSTCSFARTRLQARLQGRGLFGEHLALPAHSRLDQVCLVLSPPSLLAPS
ncbi:uncharacterized protein SCHCODRAFT_02738831 [Schizophyllum commune H4-8]|uniref:uncharacterized protein n=1 Tax=Schizophyllum commune (strain H4-8 / FGSC 9210) TaxID=578458 RepID=UPI00215F148D|nr:uncharacterized protein SCHCODRAFT_02738831 [Schizophyllum commune H4-8]KAI5889048.1 hypothetical protein SCHCODRAFT_02738831 [Schizophyllum commune H4-8]